MMLRGTGRGEKATVVLSTGSAGAAGAGFSVMTTGKALAALWSQRQAAQCVSTAQPSSV